MPRLGVHGPLVQLSLWEDEKGKEMFSGAPDSTQLAAALNVNSLTQQ